MKSPANNDWSSQVLQEQEELEISFSLEDIKQMSKSKFKFKAKQNRWHLNFYWRKKNLEIQKIRKES